MSDKILIVDDLVTNRIILKVKLTAASHAVLQAGTGAEAMAQAMQHRPALILLDMNLPDLSGIEVCRRLRADPGLRHTPIIVISASTGRDCRLAALEAGADAFLTKPLNETVLMARIRNLLRASQTDAGLRLQAETCHEFGLSEAAAGFEHPPRIALIAPDPAMARGWRAALSAHLAGEYAILAPAQALAECAGASPPDLFVIAADSARPSDAMRLIADLRARDGGRAAGLCLAMADPGQDAAALALDLGASDVVALPLDPQETALRLRLHLARQRRAADLRRAVQQGLELAATDPLTGLYNRRYALAHLDRIAARAVETGTSFAVMVLDLDRFKTVNDRFGHAAGDVVLVTVAARLAAALRPSDLVARVGGEEFLVALPDATLPMARAVAERLCAAVAGAPIALPDGLGSVSVTLSAGLTLGPDPDPSLPPDGAQPGPGFEAGWGQGHDPADGAATGAPGGTDLRPGGGAAGPTARERAIATGIGAAIRAGDRTGTGDLVGDRVGDRGVDRAGDWAGDRVGAGAGAGAGDRAGDRTRPGDWVGVGDATTRAGRAGGEALAPGAGQVGPPGHLDQPWAGSCTGRREDGFRDRGPLGGGPHDQGTRDGAAGQPGRVSPGSGWIADRMAETTGAGADRTRHDRTLLADHVADRLADRLAGCMANRLADRAPGPGPARGADQPPADGHPGGHPGLPAAARAVGGVLPSPGSQPEGWIAAGGAGAATAPGAGRGPGAPAQASAARRALIRADAALLAAKGDGRNQVTILTAA